MRLQQTGRCLFFYGVVGSASVQPSGVITRSLSGWGEAIIMLASVDAAGPPVNDSRRGCGAGELWRRGEPLGLP